MICPMCEEEMEPDIYSNGFHPIDNYICPECGYETGFTEIELLRFYIDRYDTAAISSCNSEEARTEYKTLTNWLKELLKIKEDKNEPNCY